MTHRIPCLALLTLVLVPQGCVLQGPTGPSQAGQAAITAQNAAFPSVIPLPNGFRPEGIATGRGGTFYVGSLADGSIYRGDLRTGEGAVFASATGTPAVGLALDPRGSHLFVSGGPSGTGSVIDAITGVVQNVYQLTTLGTTFINDVAVTRTGAYFTDSFRPFLYRVPLVPGKDLISPSVVEEIPLGGDFVFLSGSFNANGIVATSGGQYLLLVNSTTGDLYRVDPGTGNALRIDLGGASVVNGDGMLLNGLDLYVVQNSFNQIAVVRLDPAFSRGTLVDTITDPGFRVPTTVAAFGRSLYAVNARFDVPPAPDTEYEVVKVALPN